MSEIVVTDEQAQVITEATTCVLILDRNGTQLGHIVRKVNGRSGFTAEEIAEAECRLNSDDPRYTTKEVLDRLDSLGR